MSSGHGERASAPRWGRRRTIMLALGLGLIIGLTATVVAAGLDGAAPETIDPGHPTPEATNLDEPAPEVIGFIPYWDQDRAIAELEDHLDILSTVAPWWYAPTETGEVVVQHEGHTDIDHGFVTALQQRGRRVLPSIANHRGGEWDFEVVGQILRDPDRRANHVRQITNLVVVNGYDGIQIDYESLAARDRGAFSQFLRDLAAALDAQGKILAVAVHAKTTDAGDGEHNQSQDFAAIGRAADEVHLMTYDHHWDESPPGPIAPRSWAEDVVQYALAQMPADKIVLGIGLFGYDWGDSQTADGLTLEEVDQRRRRYAGQAGWDRRSQSPWFRYSVDGVEHEVWFEDAESVSAKVELVNRFDLAGAFIWRLGGSEPAVWDAVRRQLRPPPS